MSSGKRVIELNEHLSKFDLYEKDAYWNDLAVGFFSPSALFIITLISNETSEVKHFELPFYLIAKFFCACVVSSMKEMQILTKSPSMLCHESRDIYRYEMPHVDWTFLYENNVRVMLYGQLMVDYSKSNARLIERFEFKVDRIEECIAKVKESGRRGSLAESKDGTFNAPTSTGTPSHGHATHNDGASAPSSQSESSRTARAFEPIINEFGLCKKAMRVLEMSEVWSLMTEVMDISLLGGLGPVDCIHEIVTADHVARGEFMKKEDAAQCGSGSGGSPANQVPSENHNIYSSLNSSPFHYPSDMMNVPQSPSIGTKLHRSHSPSYFHPHAALGMYAHPPPQQHPSFAPYGALYPFASSSVPAGHQSAAGLGSIKSPSPSPSLMAPAYNSTRMFSNQPPSHQHHSRTDSSSSQKLVLHQPLHLNIESIIKGNYKKSKKPKAKPAQQTSSLDSSELVFSSSSSSVSPLSREDPAMSADAGAGEADQSMVRTTHPHHLAALDTAAAKKRTKGRKRRKNSLTEIELKSKMSSKHHHHLDAVLATAAAGRPLGHAKEKASSSSANATHTGPGYPKDSSAVQSHSYMHPYYYPSQGVPSKAHPAPPHFMPFASSTPLQTKISVPLERKYPGLSQKKVPEDDSVMTAHRHHPLPYDGKAIIQHR